MDKFATNQNVPGETSTSNLQLKLRDLFIYLFIYNLENYLTLPSYDNEANTDGSLELHARPSNMY